MAGAMPMVIHIDATASAIARAAGAQAGDDPWTGGTVAPGQFAPVVTAGREAVAGPRPAASPRRLTPRLWGVPPPPSAPDMSRAVLTVRNPESPFWIGHLRNSEFRCLVPATGLIEWNRLESGGTDHEGRRRRHLMAPGHGALMWLAAVWKDSEVPGFALMTAPPCPAYRAIGHSAMPLILTEARAIHAWLHAAWHDTPRRSDAAGLGETELPW